MSPAFAHRVIRLVLSLAVICALALPAGATGFAAGELCCEETAEAGAENMPVGQADEGSDCETDCSLGCCQLNAIAAAAVVLPGASHSPAGEASRIVTTGVTPDQPIPPPRA